MTDIEIARKVKLKKIDLIAKNLGIKKDEINLYGDYKCKVDNKVYDRIKENQNGKLILVSAISPTPLGEGKTTMSIAIADGLRKIGKKSILALREPSLGPVFGIKGGATGGGMAQVAPMEDINLHFTGDIHAITAANNLLSSMIDNHIYFGNQLCFDKVVWKRCLDLNDRQLRVVNTGLSDDDKIVPRIDGFDISVASEIMAILCLSTDIVDLKRRIGNIIVGYKKNGEAIFARDLKAEGSIAVLLKDAIKPNLVQTLEHTPAFIHGGPFANIAHGCNSIIATRMALKLGDYVVTEAGFGADLGCEKFLDIKCRKLGISPDCVVLVATIKALKYHGGVEKEHVFEKNLEALALGMDNLLKHVNNIKKFGLNVIVAINKYDKDSDEELKYLENFLLSNGIFVSVVSGWSSGGKGAIDIANKIVNLSNNKENFGYMYNLEDSIKEKITKIAKNIYYAQEVVFSDTALKEIKHIEKIGFANLPICFAKTQYSFSDDPKLLDCRVKYNIKVRNVEVKSGAEFIVVLTGKIMTMPGLPKEPCAEKIDIDSEGNIVGLS